MKGMNMLKYRPMIIAAIALTVLVGAGGLISVLIESEQGTRGGMHRTDAIILFTAFCILLLSFLVAHILSRGTFLGRRIPNRVRYIAVIGMLILIPQSTVIYGRLTQVMHSEITLFVLYNIIDVAFGRMMLALMKSKKSLPTPPNDKEENNSKIDTPISKPFTRDMIKQHLMEKQYGKPGEEKSLIDSIR
jgi:hypothetical protein